jgi:hypothetical protein
MVGIPAGDRLAYEPPCANLRFCDNICTVEVLAPQQRWPAEGLPELCEKSKRMALASGAKRS